jgi:hypothetical protein
MSKIFEALEINEVNVREAAMQTLVELVHLQYEMIELYFKNIAEATAKAANFDEAQVGL